MSSVARFGRPAYPTREEVTNRAVLGCKRHQPPCAHRRRGGSGQDGKQTWGAERDGMTATAKCSTRSEAAERRMWMSRPVDKSGKADASWEETGKSTMMAHRGRPACRAVLGAGRGPANQGRTRRDNVGKNLLAAGAVSNLQGPAAEVKAEGGRRQEVRHMSPYERRSGGNALRGDAGRRSESGNARDRQRGSGHLAVSWMQRYPVAEPETCRTCRAERARTQTTAGRGGCVTALEPRRKWEGVRRKSQGQNLTRDMRLSGIAGGPGET